jgi:hypothetical protein
LERAADANGVGGRAGLSRSDALVSRDVEARAAGAGGRAGARRGTGDAAIFTFVFGEAA